MIKCVKITCSIKLTNAITENIQKHARKLNLEGSLQVLSSDSIRIIACGTKKKTLMLLWTPSIRKGEIRRSLRLR